MSENSQQYNHPHKEATKRTALLVVGVSSLFCILLLAFLFAISTDDTSPESHVQSDDVIDLLSTPKQLGGDADSNSTDIGLELPKGGWTNID